MDIKRKRFISAFVNIFLICAITALRYSSVATFKIGNATPVVLLPLVVAIAMFFGDNASILAGLLSGILMDGFSSDSSCFNTLFFVVMSAICNLLSNLFLNRNIKAAVYLSALVSTLYFFVKYLVFFVFRGISVNYDYFMLYLIPSLVYTAIFIIPFYFLEKKISK